MWPARCEGAFGVVLLVGEVCDCERVFRGDVRVGVVGAGSDLDCGDDERRGDTRLDTRGGGGTRASGSPGGDGGMSPRPAGDVPIGRLGLSKACKNAPWGERIECGIVLEEGCDCAAGKRRPSCSRMRFFAGLKIERARDGDLERLEPVRVFGRLTSSENTGCRKHSGGSSTRTGRGILAHCLRSANWPSVAQDAICHIMSRHLYVTPVLVTKSHGHHSADSPRPPLA